MSVAVLLAPANRLPLRFPYSHHPKAPLPLLPTRLAYFSPGSLAIGPDHRLASVLNSGPANANIVVDAPDRFGLDAFLSAAELLCLAPSLALAVCGTVGIVFPRALPKLFRLNSGNALLAGQLILLACAVLVGIVIRQRQWQRRVVSMDIGESACDLLRRIEKVEEDLRGSTTVVRVLSRQLEKLGIRFRVTRRTLKDPISETAALAQKNSEATRALALQTDILEKELKEIQMVLLAMQEQQQKQLDLILTVGKAAKLFESKRTSPPPPVHDAAAKINSIHRKNELQPIDVQIRNNEDF